MVGWLLYDELERMWKGLSLGGTDENHGNHSLAPCSLHCGAQHIVTATGVEVLAAGMRPESVAWCGLRVGL
jgi:hypothetical protein